MSSPAYAIISIDLAAARDNERIVDRGVPVDNIAVIGLPVGVSCSVAIGENRPHIPLLTQGMAIEDICPYNTEGVFFTNALAAGIVTLFVSFGSGTKVGGI